MAVTLNEIAERLGIHKSTVSRVLSGNTRGSYISEKRRRQILEAAADMGFRPNALARAVRTGKTFQVGVFVTTAGTGPRSTDRLSHQAIADILMGINAGLAAAGYIMVLRGLAPDEQEMHDVRELREHVFDGLIVVGAHTEGVVDSVDGAYPNCVFVDSTVWRPERCIRRDEQSAGRLVVTRLAELGYRRIRYVDIEDGPRRSPHYSASLRYAGAEAAAKEFGLDFAFTPFDGPRCGDLPALLDAPRETAFVAYSAYKALQIQTIAARTGRRIGTDFALAACDSISLLSWTWPDLARVEFDRWAMGHEAARMALGSLDNPGEPCPSRLTIDDWVYGGSATAVSEAGLPASA